MEGLSKTIDGVKILDNLTFTLNHDDKVAFVGGNELAKTVLFKILIGEMDRMKVLTNGESRLHRLTSRKTSAESSITITPSQNG